MAMSFVKAWRIGIIKRREVIETALIGMAQHQQRHHLIFLYRISSAMARRIISFNGVSGSGNMAVSFDMCQRVKASRNAA